MNKQLSEELRKIELLEPYFLDKVDAHIAFFQERNLEKQKILHSVFEHLERAYLAKRKELYGT